MALACLAICGPALLARNIAPSATFFNQALALAGWGLFLALMASTLAGESARALRKSAPALIALALLMLATVLSFMFERLPAGLALSALGMLAAAMLTLIVGSLASRHDIGRIAFQAVCIALLVAGVLSLLLALVQVFAPSWAEGEWIARSSTPGRAGGNLRQPNHLSSLLLWSMASLVWLHEALVERQPGPGLKPLRVATAGLMVLLIFGDVLTVSRTGTVCIVLLALWGVLDKQLSRFSRVLLWLAPLLYVLCWVGMNEWAQAGASSFAGGTQLQKSDLSSSRFGIWANTLSLIAQNPWFGVGWGEFNLAWSLTPFPGRPVAFFDHTHNLPLQLLVEIGIPLGTLVLASLAWALWKAFVACGKAAPSGSLTARTALVMVLMMVVHSMLEYPLWYAYFLLPTAFALGLCLGHGSPANAESDNSVTPWFRRVLVGASLALVVGTGASVIDYLRVASIFVSSEDDMPLSYRIAQGQRSWFFAHHADYADATTAEPPSKAMKAFRRAPHYLLDTRLMMAWAKALADRGDVERARYIAQRLKEFRNADSDEFFAECDKPRAAGEPLPFQCTPSTRSFNYEDFKMR
ncbi:MAG: O-antigen ligase C-terminal domain-containing protein [Cytophagales bacterium]|nr:O-antigen ligase C-terminal domain-containing protein [Rhizobacter sp.]